MYHPSLALYSLNHWPALYRIYLMNWHYKSLIHIPINPIVPKSFVSSLIHNHTLKIDASVLPSDRYPSLPLTGRTVLSKQSYFNVDSYNLFATTLYQQVVKPFLAVSYLVSNILVLTIICVHES